MMFDDDRDFEQLARTIRELDPPPPAPREELWLRIQAERAARLDGADCSDARSAGERSQFGSGLTAATAGVIALPARSRRQWVQWGAALAAMLVLGIGLGRFSLQHATSSDPATTAAAPSSLLNDAVVVPGPYRLAATQHLERTEMLLTSLHVDGRTTDAQAVSAWATDLLTNTRLLLASPAAEDAATRRLLEDLELVLAQVATIPAARAAEEVELIQDGLNQSDVLLRLRAATAVRRTVGT